MFNKEIKEKDSSLFVWPDVTCQKLFYDEHTVVNSISDIKPDMESGNYLE